jgi:archaellin
MTRWNVWGSKVYGAYGAMLSLTILTAACGGGGDALGLKHKVSDKELAGLDTEAVLRLEAQKAEVVKAEEVWRNADFAMKNIDANLKSSDQQTENAEKAIDAAKDKIEATSGSEEKDLEQARAKYQRQQAELKQRYEEETRKVRERYAQEQAKNRTVLNAAKGNKALADAQVAVHKAEAAEHKAGKTVSLHEVRVQKSRFELSRLEESNKLTGVVGPEQVARKAAFDAQLAEEEKKLAAAKAEHQKKQEALKLAQGRLDQEKGRAQPQ